MQNDFEVKSQDELTWSIKYVNVFDRISFSENEHFYRNGNFVRLEEKNEFSIEESKSEKGDQVFILNIKNKEKNYHYQIKAYNRIILEHIIFHVTA